jgi:hypothetical protein
VHAASRRLIIYRPLAVNFTTVIPVSLSQVSADSTAGLDISG